MTGNVVGLMAANVFKSMQPPKEGKATAPTKPIQYRGFGTRCEIIAFYAKWENMRRHMQSFLNDATDMSSRWYNISARTIDGEPLEDVLGTLRGDDERVFECDIARLTVGDVIIIKDNRNNVIYVDAESVAYPFTIEEKDDYLNWTEKGFRDSSKSMLYFGIDHNREEEEFEPELRFDPNDFTGIEEVILRRTDIMWTQENKGVWVQAWFTIRLEDKDPEAYNDCLITAVYNMVTKEITYVRKPTEWDDFRKKYDLKAIRDNGVYESLANATWLEMSIEAELNRVMEECHRLNDVSNETYEFNEKSYVKRRDHPYLVLTEEEEQGAKDYDDFWDFHDTWINITDMNGFKSSWSYSHHWEYGEGETHSKDPRRKDTDDLQWHRYHAFDKRRYSVMDRLTDAAIPAHAQYKGEEYELVRDELNARVNILLGNPTGKSIDYDLDEGMFDNACAKVIDLCALPDKELFKLVWSME